MVGLPYPNIKSPELNEKIEYLNSTMVSSSLIPRPFQPSSFAIGLFIHTCHSESNAPPSLPSTAQTPRWQAAGSGPLRKSLYEGSEPVHRPIHPPFKGLCLHCACGPEIREGQCEGKTTRVDRSTTPDLFGVWSGICSSEEGTTWCATY